MAAQELSAYLYKLSSGLALLLARRDADRVFFVPNGEEADVTMPPALDPGFVQYLRAAYNEAHPWAIASLWDQWAATLGRGQTADQALVRRISKAAPGFSPHQTQRSDVRHQMLQTLVIASLMGGRLESKRQKLLCWTYEKVRRGVDGQYLYWEGGMRRMPKPLDPSPYSAVAALSRVRLTGRVAALANHLAEHLPDKGKEAATLCGLASILDSDSRGAVLRPFNLWPVTLQFDRTEHLALVAGVREGQKPSLDNYFQVYGALLDPADIHDLAGNHHDHEILEAVAAASLREKARAQEAHANGLKAIRTACM
jgi:hypothetical protein